MGQVTRRQLLLGGSALVGAGVMPGLRLFDSVRAAEIPRPDYLIRAGTNENPWGPSRVALQAIADSFKVANQYGGDREGLIALIGQQVGLPPQNISLGSGSGEILNVGGMLASMNGGSVVCPDPTYHGVTRYAEQTGSEIIRVPVNEGLNVDLDAMRKAVRQDSTLVYLPNPNNPIPSVVEKNSLREFVLEMAESRLVFVDEAYHEFVDNPVYSTMLGLIREGYRNIIVSRTASKIHGLAGLRIGFGFAHPDLITEIDNRKTGGINILGLNAAIASYKDREFQAFTLRKNKESLAIVEGMHEELGHRYVKSNTNFSFFHTGRDIREVGPMFLEHNLYVGRPFPPMLDWLRVSMAKPHEMEYFVQTYKKLFT